MESLEANQISGSSQKQKTDLRKAKVTYGDIAYDYLLKAILSHELKAGQRLRPEDIGAEVGLSATPIKYALARLAGDGLVEFRPGQGPHVVASTISEIVELHEAILLCEMGAIQKGMELVNDEFLAEMRRLLTQHESASAAMDGSIEALRKSVEADRQVHLHIMSMWRNGKIQAWYRQLDFQIRLVRQLPIFGYRREGVVAEHQAICDALERRDISGAKEAVRRHVEAARDALVEQARVVGLK